MRTHRPKPCGLHGGGTARDKVARHVDGEGRKHAAAAPRAAFATLMALMAMIAVLAIWQVAVPAQRVAAAIAQGDSQGDASQGDSQATAAGGDAGDGDAGDGDAGGGDASSSNASSSNASSANAHREAVEAMLPFAQGMEATGFSEDPLLLGLAAQASSQDVGIAVERGMQSVGWDLSWQEDGLMYVFERDETWLWDDVSVTGAAVVVSAIADDMACVTVELF